MRTKRTGLEKPPPPPPSMLLNLVSLVGFAYFAPWQIWRWADALGIPAWLYWRLFA